MIGEADWFDICEKVEETYNRLVKQAEKENRSLPHGFKSGFAAASLAFKTNFNKQYDKRMDEA